MGDVVTPEPRCALHVDVVAAGPCARCGSFACAACLGHGTARLCVACAARASPAAELPLWERRAETGVSIPAAFFRTIRDVLTQPTRFFAGVREGTSLLPPLVFALGIQLLSGVLSLIFGVGITLATGRGFAEVRTLAVENARWMGFALLIEPVRVLGGALVLTPLGMVAGVNARPVVRTARWLAYLSVVWLPVQLWPSGLPSAPAVLVAAGYACVGFAAVHQAPLRRAVVTLALLVLPLLCLFVGIYQLFSSH